MLILLYEQKSWLCMDYSVNGMYVHIYLQFGYSRLVLLAEVCHFADWYGRTSTANGRCSRPSCGRTWQNFLGILENGDTEIASAVQ